MAQTLARARSPADAGDAILEKNRWIKTSLGSYKSGSRIKEIQGFRIYVYRDHQFTHERIDQMPDRFLKRSERDWSWFHTYLDYHLVDPVRVCLVCHTGKADITSFDQDINLTVMRRLTEVQGGVITLLPIRMTPRSKGKQHGYRINHLNVGIRY